jgi:hypothetical protein
LHRLPSLSRLDRPPAVISSGSLIKKNNNGVFVTRCNRKFKDCSRIKNSAAKLS